MTAGGDGPERLDARSMHIRDRFQNQRTTFSFEFFPPKDEAGVESLYATMADIEDLKPSFVSVTYGAGGSTRQRTHDLVVRVKRETGLEPVPHLTCVCHDEGEIRDVLERYASVGISNIMALRGDMPKERPANGIEPFRHFKHAADLVRSIQRFNAQGGHADRRGFGIGVAGYPEGHPATPNRMTELDLLRAKVDEGADFIATQLFFDNRDFYDFRDRCELAGIKVPILAGIMPVTSLAGMVRMAELAACVRYPAPLQRALNRTGGEKDAVRRVGVHWATEQCRDLLDHQVAGIHFYTLNKSTATREIYRTLGVRDSTGLV